MDTLEVLEHPVVKELMESSKEAYAEKHDLLPYVNKDLLLMSPGRWNKRIYTKDEIVSAYNNTTWDDRHITAMYADHKDRSVPAWLGELKNIRLDDNEGIVYGDFYCYDFDTAIKLGKGKMKSGISPKVDGMDDGIYMKNFVFKNFSHVVTPAVKSAYIFNSEGGDIIYKDENFEEELARVTAFEKLRKEKGMTPGEFYAIPMDPPSESKLPIFDAAHVRNALARINQVKGVSTEEKAKARTKIEAAAKKFEIKVGGADMAEKVEGTEKKTEGTEETKPEVKKEVPTEGEKTEETTTENENSEKELEEFSEFFKGFKKENPEATLQDALAAFKKKGGESESENAGEEDEEEDKDKDKEEKVIENIDLKGMSKNEAIKVLEESLGNIKSDKVKLSDQSKEAIKTMKSTIKEMAQDIKTLKEEKDSAERLGVTTVTAELADTSFESSGNAKMLDFLRQGL